MYLLPRLNTWGNCPVCLEKMISQHLYVLTKISFTFLRRGGLIKVTESLSLVERTT